MLEGGAAECPCGWVAGALSRHEVQRRRRLRWVLASNRLARLEALGRILEVAQTAADLKQYVELARFGAPAGLEGCFRVGSI